MIPIGGRRGKATGKEDKERNDKKLFLQTGRAEKVRRSRKIKAKLGSKTEEERILKLELF